MTSLLPRPGRLGRLVSSTLTGLLLLIPSPASAVYQCGNKKDDCICGMSNPYPCCDNGGNCTWWAWESACCNWKIGLPGWGNANQWAGNAKANPKFVVKSSPVPKSIGVRVSGSYGHVVWVTAVNGSTVTVSEMNCWGNYGERTATYQASYFDGGFIVPKPQCACTAGQKESQACGNCGEKTRTCGADCQWGAWSGCGGEGPCAAGKTESQPCGACGQRARTCSKECAWGEWGSCGSEGTCAPGKTESQPCGECGQQTRSCSSACGWESWSECVAPTDLGATCATDLPGACASGTMTCAEGKLLCAPPAGCTAAGDATPTGDAGSQPIGGPDAGVSVNQSAGGELVGGCACQAAGPPGPPSLILLLGLLALGARRSRGSHASRLYGTPRPRRR